MCFINKVCADKLHSKYTAMHFRVSNMLVSHSHGRGCNACMLHKIKTTDVRVCF